MKRDYREEAFRTKFLNASRELGVAPYEVISLKFRDIVSSYGDYHEMLRNLEHESGIISSPMKDNLQGQGHLIRKDEDKIIVVEHETGLEILCIAGSIASLIGLVPFVLQFWTAIRGHRSHHHHGDDQQIEIRRVDKSGKLHEECSRDIPVLPGLPVGVPYSTLLLLARQVEGDLLSMKQQVQSYADHLAAIEGRLKALEPVKDKKRTNHRQTSKKVLKSSAGKSRRSP